MLKDWGQKTTMSIVKLRQKCVALILHTAMCRPSDISLEISFLYKQIVLNTDGCATIEFFWH